MERTLEPVPQAGSGGGRRDFGETWAEVTSKAAAVTKFAQERAPPWENG